MKYYQWIVMPKEAEYNKDYAIIQDIYGGNGVKIPVWKFLEGEVVESWDNKAYSTFKHKLYQWDSLVHKLDVKIISHRFKSFLESLNLGSEVQYFPLGLYDESILIANYFILNMVDPVDCIDLKKTSHTVIDEESGEIEPETWPIILNESKISDRKLFRLKRHNSTIVIREDIVKLIEQNGFTGFDFISMI